MKVAPSHEIIHLAYVYTKAKQTVVNWLVENKPSFKNKTVSICRDTFSAVFELLKRNGKHHLNELVFRKSLCHYLP